MTANHVRVWPRSLAGRLTLLLVLTLAVAQLGLTLLLSRERDTVVEELMHSQALNQAVTLARLVNETPAADTERLLGAFRSRTVCAAIEAAPEPEPMSPQEQRLAGVLRSMLHGIDAGMPRVGLGRLASERPDCGDAGFRFPHRAEEHEPDGDDDDELASLRLQIPLNDGRWLMMQSAVELPGESNRLAIASFLVSALAVAVVAIWVVRSQTRLLRDLADASERFGRGEKVEPLPVAGPSEVVAATQAFNTMQERLSQFIGERMRLLAGISHDLRTPLTTLRLKAELLDDEAARDGIVATVEEMSRIAEAALAFTRAEAVNEATVTANLAEPVAEVIDEFRLAGSDVTPLKMDFVEAPCRPISLKRAVRNLVENAVRYGGSAQLSVYRAGSDAVVEVIDEGPGIPQDRIADAFKPFVTLDPARNAENGGIGLGLAIALGIVHAHGGTIELANRASGRGLSATIRLPAAPVAAASDV